MKLKLKCGDAEKIENARLSLPGIPFVSDGVVSMIIRWLIPFERCTYDPCCSENGMEWWNGADGNDYFWRSECTHAILLLFCEYPEL